MGFTSCPVCGLMRTKIDSIDGTRASKLNCFRCGEYEILNFASNRLKNLKENVKLKSKLSIWIRNNPGVIVDNSLIDQIDQLNRPDLETRVKEFMLLLSKNQMMGEQFTNPFHDYLEIFDFLKKDYVLAEINYSERFSLFAISWCSTILEYDYFINQYIVKNLELIDTYTEGGEIAKITPKGWEFIENANKSNPDSNTVFMAFQFSGNVKDYNVNVVSQAIRDAMYDADYLLLNDHNNSIYDEIIARIRRAKFVVADLTNGNANVYYEAGFAKGLGKDVIYICEENSLENKDHVKFDVRQYSVIPYKLDEKEEFPKALQSRIESTLGRGKNKKIDEL